MATQRPVESRGFCSGCGVEGSTVRFRTCVARVLACHRDRTRVQTHDDPVLAHKRLFLCACASMCVHSHSRTRAFSRGRSCTCGHAYAHTQVKTRQARCSMLLYVMESAHIDNTRLVYQEYSQQFVCLLVTWVSCRSHAGAVCSAPADKTVIFNLGIRVSVSRPMVARDF